MPLDLQIGAGYRNRIDSYGLEDRRATANTYPAVIHLQ